MHTLLDIHKKIKFSSFESTSYYFCSKKIVKLVEYCKIWYCIAEKIVSDPSPTCIKTTSIFIRDKYLRNNSIYLIFYIVCKIYRYTITLIYYILTSHNIPHTKSFIITTLFLVEHSSHICYLLQGFAALTRFLVDNN